jgi:hypothetical protein
MHYLHFVDCQRESHQLYRRVFCKPTTQYRFPNQATKHIPDVNECTENLCFCTDRDCFQSNNRHAAPPDHDLRLDNLEIKTSPVHMISRAGSDHLSTLVVY